MIQEKDQQLVLESGFSLSERAHEEDGKETSQVHEEETMSIDQLREMVVNDMLGSDATFTSPLEWKAGDPVQVPLVYADFTASHRPVKSIERYLENTCMPFYGNTHTNTSITGSQSTAFCSEARQLIGEACGAKITGKASQDVVLFSGNGTTCAISLLIDCLGLKLYSESGNDKPLIILGPYEHHSNMLPWRELGFDIETINLRNGNVDLDHLEQVLKQNSSRSVKIGSFSAVSNLTGTIADDLAITAMLHKHGALSVFDYATGASYLNMNMNPTHPKYPDPSLIAKDAIVFSGHKLIGGVGTPGVLVIKKRLVSQVNPPSMSGGGTVFYVSKDSHRFLSNRVERYEGGTPNVAGIWKLGLVWQFKRRLLRLLPQGQNLVEFEIARAERIQQRLKGIPNLMLLDDGFEAQKVPVYSFLIKCGERFLHYNFVCALLNDLFGIQSRGGCQCAGPYAQMLLGMLKHNHDVEHWLVHSKDEALRPGVTRFSLPTIGTSQEQEAYVLNAIEWVAKHGWKFMHVYRCNQRTGEWRHKSRSAAPLGRKERLWLSHFDPLSPMKSVATYPPQISVQDALNNAHKLLQLVLKDQSSISQSLKMTEENDDTMLRWYVYPKDVASYIQEGVESVPGTYDRSSVSGALRPVSWFKSDPSLSAPVIPQKQLPYRFRDGEHTGEASLQEIEEGFEDEELSKNCHIFNPEADAWELLSVFLASRGKQTVTVESRQNTMEGETDAIQEAEISSERLIDGPMVVDPQLDNDDVQEIYPKANAASDDKPSITDAVPIVDKRDQKKPSRDSKSWGHGVKMPLTAIVSNGEATTSRSRRSKHVKPPAKLMRLVTQAIIQWDMIQDGDRLLLGLSGGKDSLSLLHILLEFQKKLPIKFDIEVCTVDPMTPSFDPSSLIPYVESLGLKYHYIKDEIVERAMSSGKDGEVVSSLCAFCARMKRGNLYGCARRNNCNKLVLAQHLDDLAESFMMSVMHNGFLRTMKANYKINAGDLSVIRPLVYARESLMTEFAKSANLPIINENCPACFEEPKERARIKKMLSREETLYPYFFDNIKRSMMPLMHDDATAILRSYTEEALAKSRKYPKGTNGKPKPSPFQKTETSDTPTDPEKQDYVNQSKFSLQELSEEQLVRELARRRAERFRLAGAMPGAKTDEIDPTGQVCTLNGGEGSIPCRELME